MGQTDLFAKRTYAMFTDEITGGAVTWLEPPEIGLEKVQADGYFIVCHAKRLEALAHPWPEAAPHVEIMIEIKMAGDHLDVLEFERGLLRRQARQVQRLQECGSGKPRWLGLLPIWFVAPHVPEWLEPARGLVRVAQGCYRVEACGFPNLWIAANELPLVPELVPFLVARSGKKLDEFARWVVTTNIRVQWLLEMLECVPMTPAAQDELTQRLWAKKEDPEIEARVLRIIDGLLAARPELVDRASRDAGMLAAVRAALRHVLARRGLQLEAADEIAIEQCTDIATLQRWHDQAITASSTSEALA